MGMGWVLEVDGAAGRQQHLWASWLCRPLLVAGCRPGRREDGDGHGHGRGSWRWMELLGDNSTSGRAGLASRCSSLDVDPEGARTGEWKRGCNGAVAGRLQLRQ